MTQEGIAPHPDFEDRIKGFADMVNEKETPYDFNGHGTHVSGIIAGSGKLSEEVFAGMAPKSHIIMIKVLDEKGDGDIENVVKAIAWVRRYQKQYNIRVVNISVGMLPHVNNENEKKLLRAVESLWDDGLVVVAAAGNYGPAYGSVTTPGVSKKIITVGSSDDWIVETVYGEKKKHYSGRGPTRECVVKPDLVAPGTLVTSCNGRFRRSGKPYITKSGTSMATPVVAGAAALLLSKYPDMSNVEVKLRFRESCMDLGFERNRQGWGVLHVGKLLGS